MEVCRPECQKGAARGEDTFERGAGRGRQVGRDGVEGGDPIADDEVGGFFTVQAFRGGGATEERERHSHSGYD